MNQIYEYKSSSGSWKLLPPGCWPCELPLSVWPGNLKLPPKPLLCCRVWAKSSYFLMSASVTERRANFIDSSKCARVISGTKSSSSSICQINRVTISHSDHRYEGNLGDQTVPIILLTDFEAYFNQHFIMFSGNSVVLAIFCWNLATNKLPLQQHSSLQMKLKLVLSPTNSGWFMIKKPKPHIIQRI